MSRTCPASPLPLSDGERLTQEEFHRRYEAYPEDVKIELIGGVVHVASPMRYPHGDLTQLLGGVCFLYRGATPGVGGADDVSAILGEKSEPQPDLMLRIHPECGGQSRLNEKNYLVGAPEWVAEVSHATRRLDLGAKKRDYLDAGVQEYLVVDVEEAKFHWFHFPSKRNLKPDKAGIWRSRAFPGFWIDGPALLAIDIPKLIAAIQLGTASPEHQEFVQRLAARRQAST